MKIIKDSITSLARRGYITLQIPQISIELGGGVTPVEEVPDEWIAMIHSSGSVAVGKETGFSYLTRIGWEKNKSKIKEAYEGAEHQRGPWEKFERYAEKHFKAVEEANKRRIRFLQKKVEQLRGLDKGDEPE